MPRAKPTSGRRLTKDELRRVEEVLDPLVENDIPFGATHTGHLTCIAAELIERGEELLRIADGLPEDK